MASKAELALILSLVDEVSKTARGIKGELLDVGKTGQGLQGTLRDVGSGLASLGTTAIIGGIGLATAAVTSLGAACAKLAIDALPLEGIRDSFHGIADDGDAMLAMLREGSLGMVRDTELMKSYNLAAQLVGKTFADQLPDAMGYLSKVAAATGQDMGYMMDSLVKGVGRLSGPILDNLGIQVQLSDATARAAEMFGVEASELTKAQQQAGMMDVVLEKLRENTKDMPEVSEAQRLWASLGVTLGNLKDEVGLALIPTLLRLLKPLGELISTHGPALVSLFEAHVIPILETVAGAVGVFIAEVGKGASPLEAIRAALATVIPPETMAQIEDIIARVQGLATTVGTFVSDHAEEFKAALIAIGALLAGAAIASGIHAIAIAIGGLLNPVTLVIAAVGLLGAAWAGNWGGIRDTTQAVIDWIMPYVQGALGMIQGWWEENKEAILATVSTLWSTVQGIFESVMAVVGPAVSTFIEGIQNGFAGVGPLIEALKGLWESLLPVFEVVAAAIGGVIALLVGVILGMFNGIANAIEPFINMIVTVAAGIITALSGVIDFVSGFVELIVALFTGNGEDVGQALSKMGDAVVQIWEGLKTAVEGLVTGLVDTVLSYVSGFVEGIVGFFTGLYDTLVGHSIIPDLVRDIVEAFARVDWLQLGKDIISGIADGIKNAASFLADAARNAARAALEAAKGFLGIHSPSSVAAEMIGVPFVEGIGAGIDRAMGQLAQTQLANLSARMAAVPVAGGAAHGGSSSASIDYDRLGGAVATAMRAHPTYQISANYRYQDERELRDDLRLLQMLGAAT